MTMVYATLGLPPAGGLDSDAQSFYETASEHSSDEDYRNGADRLPNEDSSDDDYDYKSDSPPKAENKKKNRPMWKWGYKRLVKLVNDAKGAASERLLSFIKEHMHGTKLIFVMGQSGTGKSTLLEELTGMDLKIGNTLSSGTLQYCVCPAVVDGEHFIFVDTAGFGAADIDDMENFKDIMACLSALGPFLTVAGILFVYGPPGERLTNNDLRTIRWIQCFAGPEFFRNITIVTTHWDGHGKKRFKNLWTKVDELKRQEDMKRILEPQGRYYGGSMYHHGVPGGQGPVSSPDSTLDPEDDHEERGNEARDLIRRRYMNAKTPKLQIARELDEGIPVLETQAAKVFRSHVQSTSIEILDGRAVVVAKAQDGTPLEIGRTATTAAPQETPKPTPTPTKDETAPSSKDEKAPLAKAKETPIQGDKETPLQEDKKTPLQEDKEIPIPKDDETPSTKIVKQTAQLAPPEKEKQAPPPESPPPAQTPNTADTASKQPPKKQESWFDKLMFWFKVGVAAASFFQDARKTEFESNNKKEEESPRPWWNVAGRVRSWFG